MKTLTILAALLFFPLSLLAQELPFETLALKLPEAAVTAIQVRDSGKPKSFLTDALPKKGSSMTRAGREMHQIVDDIYDFPRINSPAYFAYTRERLQQELRGKKAPARFSDVSERVLTCQARFPKSNTPPLMDCVIRAVQEYRAH